MIKTLNQNKSKDNKSKRKKILFFGGTGLLALLLIYLILSIYYNNHFYKNTIINGVNVSNMTVNHVEDAINAHVRSYILTLEERNNMSEKIYGSDINLNPVFDGSLAEILGKQNGFAWPFYFNKTHELKINTMLEYDESLLKKYFKELECFDEENIVEPVNAHVSEYGENGYEIVPEDQGAKVKEDKLYKVIKKFINSLEPTLSLEKAGCYEKTKVNSKDPQLLEAVNEMNKIASTKITYKFGEATEIVDGKQISEWLSVDDSCQVILDAEGIKKFVDYIGKTYNTFGRVRTFKTSYGDVLKINGGDYGWWLNRGKEVSELKELILAGKQVEKEPAYFQVARQYGDDDIGDTYVEVNLTAQHLFLYKEGKLVMETDFVSGNLWRNYGTPTGTYPIQYKENDATLNGEDYSTPVKYWMPFNGNIGFHDAPWRKSFGKDIYIKNGSHGCINMPPANAKILFENIRRGVAVVVYELEGTENYNIKKNEEKEQKENTLNAIRSVSLK